MATNRGYRGKGGGGSGLDASQVDARVRALAQSKVETYADLAAANADYAWPAPDVRLGLLTTGEIIRASVGDAGFTVASSTATSTPVTGTVVSKTSDPPDADLATLRARVPASGQPTDQSWWAALADGRIARIEGGDWTAPAVAATTPDGTVVNVTSATTPLPASLAALDALFPAATKPANVVWEGSYTTPAGTATARVVDGAWVEVDAPTPGTILNVTRLPLPADLAALEAQSPAATKPADVSWFSLTAPTEVNGPNRSAAVIGTAWAYIDGPQPAGAATQTGATATTAGTVGLTPAAPAGAQGLTYHGDGLWRMPIPNWTANTDYSEGEPAWQGQRIIRRRPPGGKSLLNFDDLEAAEWEVLADHGNPDVHLPLSALTPATAGQPTAAEVKAAIAAAKAVDCLCYWTGDNLATSPAAYVWHVDTTGNLLELVRPVVAQVDPLQDRSGDVVVITTSGPTVALDVAQGAAFDVTLGADLTAVNWSWLPTPANPAFQSVTVRLAQDGTGGRTVDFSAFGTLIGATPSLTATPNASPAALFSVVTFDGGVSRYVR